MGTMNILCVSPRSGTWIGWVSPGFPPAGCFLMEQGVRFWVHLQILPAPLWAATAGTCLGDKPPWCHSRWVPAIWSTCLECLCWVPACQGLLPPNLILFLGTIYWVGAMPAWVQFYSLLPFWSTCCLECLLEIDSLTKLYIYAA